MQHHEYSESTWESAWLRQAKSGDVYGLPPMVPETIQSRLHGTTGAAAMQGALKFRRVLKEKIGRISSDAKLLDFGCGWGRHIRVFLKDFRDMNIYGVDIDPANIALLKKCLPNEVNIIQCYEGQPIALASNSVDLIISFSVFSHINEESAKYWLNELRRLLKPEGYIVITSWGKALFDIFARLKETNGEIEYDWERNIDRSFPDKESIKRLYHAGQFVFGRHGSAGDSLDSNIYGISLMPKAWIENEMALKVENCIEDPSLVPQTTFILRKIS